jgi:hypothetical protein
MSVPPGLSFRPGPPVYWLQEQSGKMKQIIQKFLNDQDLNQYELEVLRWYYHQWVAAMPSRPDDYNRILIMSQRELKLYNMKLLNEYGIDPL